MKSGYILPNSITGTKRQTVTRDRLWWKKKIPSPKKTKNSITVTFTVQNIVTVTAKIFYHRQLKKSFSSILWKKIALKFLKFACGALLIIQAVRERCREKISKKGS